MAQDRTFAVGEKVTSKWSGSGAVWVVESAHETTGVGGSRIRYDLRHLFRDMKNNQWGQDLRPATEKDIGRVTRARKPKDEAAADQIIATLASMNLDSIQRVIDAAESIKARGEVA